jgi:hypothetical protein
MLTPQQLKSAALLLIQVFINRINNLITKKIVIYG